MHEIKDSRHDDLNMIAICHMSAFPDSLSSKMGLKYLRKMIAWYLSDEKKFLFHIEENNRCIGYCGGMICDGSQAMGSASGMIQYSFNDAVAAILFRPWLLFHRELLEKYSLISKNVKRKFFSKPKKQNARIKSEAEIQPTTGLVVIGVDKAYQGKGYGSMLLTQFEKKSIELGIKKMALTVKSSNKQAIRSYEQNGWIKGKLTGTSLEMTKEISN